MDCLKIVNAIFMPVFKLAGSCRPAKVPKVSFLSKKKHHHLFDLVYSIQNVRNQNPKDTSHGSSLYYSFLNL